ncbi:interferon-inducible GTPase 5-like [Eublepharis macularius]|uniref:Interferon-inducible GTPase 5-like n=1 Tax=Eublepharis macularius TaxID=481883 RepID=A0AA97LH89_EUBMA|nr:interferon-inducible GTPase 5-like [Eublepharis macularius]
MGGKSSTPQESKENTFDVAITGASGTGKSSLVNALRGLSDFAEGAAQTDVIEGTTEPTGYPHPLFPDVTIWDLPGTGTPKFKANEYLRRVNFSQYDFFIIVAAERFTIHDIQLSHEIQKLGKHFYYVRSKMDEDIKNEKRKPDFSEEAALQKVRADCLGNLVQAGISSPQIFLISNSYWDKYDLPLLKRTLQNEIDDFERRASVAQKENPKSSTETPRSPGFGSVLSEAVLKIDLAKLKDAVSQRSLTEVTGEIRRELDALENVRLDIAITGVSGAGKSSLVNALRGMADFEDGAAEVGIIQTTMEVHAYPHPLFPKVTIWDLPGIGTPEFNPKDYLKKVHFSQYDFFIIVSSTRFTENDVLLAQEIHKMNKKFYYVRTKVDASLDAQRRKRDFSEEETLERIRKYCCDNLTEAGESNPRVFLISRWDLHMYDFPLLQEALENDLDDLKRHALILAMPVFSRKILKKKKAAMDGLIWKLALVSCGIGAIPVPGLSLVCDIGILVTGLLLFYYVFCLDEDSLRRVAKTVNKDYEVLKSAIKKCPMSSKITPELVTGLLARSLVCAALAGVEIAFYFVPVLGSLVGGITSFATTFYMLKSFLKDVVEDAENVRAKVAEP